MEHNHTYKNILIAFILNLFFSIFEIVGGIISGSVAILSDSVHDFGDALVIGLSYFLEKKSAKELEKNNIILAKKYSLTGALITTLILLIGSVIVIISAIFRIFNPIEINYNGMLVIAIIGVVINLVASYVTSDGKSLNQKAVNLHMLEDVLGWLMVLIVAVVIRFVNFDYLDSILSICISLFMIYAATKNLIEIRKNNKEF